MSVCTCGFAAVCPRDCSGTLAQQRECVESGHLTDANVGQLVRGEPLVELLPDEFCYRCGEGGDGGG